MKYQIIESSGDLYSSEEGLKIEGNQFLEAMNTLGTIEISIQAGYSIKNDWSDKTHEVEV